MKRSFLLLSLLVINVFLPVVVRADHLMHEKYVPFRGESDISADSYSRYTVQWAAWNSFGKQAYTEGNDTYEHETVFYNYDGKAYATGPLSTTKGSGWDTTLPDPYLDTQALDGNNEYNIAVGTFDPDLISTGIWYQTWVRLKSTNSNQSKYKISGQRGDSICEAGAWCVGNHQTAILIPYKNELTAPELDRNYRYEYDANTDGQNYAAQLYLGWWGPGVISSASDADYFYFDVPTSRTVNFILKLSQLSGIDYDVKILNSSGQTVAGGYNGSGQDEIFSSYLSAGRYYAKIYSYSGSSAVTTYNFISY